MARKPATKDNCLSLALPLVLLVVLLPYTIFLGSHRADVMGREQVLTASQTPGMPGAPATVGSEASSEALSRELIDVIQKARVVLDKPGEEVSSGGTSDQPPARVAETHPGKETRQMHSSDLKPIARRPTEPKNYPPSRSAKPVVDSAVVIAPPISSSSQDNEGPRNLVIGLGTGITPENLAVFAGSFRAVCPRGSLVLYLDSPLPEKHRLIVEKFSVTAMEFSESLIDPPFLRKYHPSNYRWPLLHRYMKDHAAKYDKVVLADVRDSMFQENPFSAFTTGFYAFNGVESRTIGECGWNGGWVKDCFGPKMLSEISRKPIICSGVSMGSTKEVVAYLGLMQELMETEKFATCERNGVDQGVHNVLVHTNRIPNLKVFTQSDGWVANMQAHSGSTIGPAGQVHNKARSRTVAIVHQYDRYRQLQQRYFDRFIFWDRDEAAAQNCKDFKIEEGFDLFKAKCDLKVTSGHSNDNCCETCLRTQGCQAWTAAGSQCYLKNCKTPQSRVAMNGVASGYLR